MNNTRDANSHTGNLEESMFEILMGVDVLQNTVTRVKNVVFICCALWFIYVVIKCIY